MTEIDNVDYAILTMATDANKPLWKNKVHKRLHDNGDGVPRSDVSVQTVGRRIDTLTEKDYLESCITSPDELTRDLIIAFKMTEKGEQAVKAKRRELVKEIIRTNLFPEDRQDDVLREPVVKTIREEFDVDTDTEQTLAEYDTLQLVAVLTTHYAEQTADALLNEEERRLFQQVKTPSTQEQTPSLS